MKRLAYISSWLGFAIGLMLVVGGLVGVVVREADSGYGDPYMVMATEYLGDNAPRPEFRLGTTHLVVGCGLAALAVPGMVISLRRSRFA